MADQLTLPSTARPTDPTSTGSAPVPDAVREVQDRLASLLPWLASFDAELAALHERLPTPPAAEADAMEMDERPESLSHSLRTAIECARIDWLPRLREILERATTIRRRDLERDWSSRRAISPAAGKAADRPPA